MNLTILTLIAMLITTAEARASAIVHCKYVYMGMPFSEMILDLDDAQRPAATATMLVQGRSETITVKPDVPTSTQLVHAWLAAEKPDESVELTVYKIRQSQGDSKLTNHHIPIGQDVWGNCTIAARPTPSRH